MKNKQSIAVIVPTIREEQYADFYIAWLPLFIKHEVTLYKVVDGDKPYVQVNGDKKYSVKDVMGKKNADLIFNKNDGVRNLGFALAYQHGHDIFISLDDDVRPEGDTIQDHLDVLSKRFSTSWMNSVQDVYMRGFPYLVRDESEAVFSHGAWKGVADLDASSQLVLGTPKVTPHKMPVPKNVMMPVCVMNVAFKRCVMPYYYQAPMGPRAGLDRFADIWSGVYVKNAIDSYGWAMVTGYATVNHNRASNPFVNLIKEAKGISLNESFWRDVKEGLPENFWECGSYAPDFNNYFKMYSENIERWEDFIDSFEDRADICARNVERDLRSIF